MLSDAQLRAILPNLSPISVHGPWARIIDYHHLMGPTPDPLWGGGASVRGARFTPQGGVNSIYLSYDAITALTEVRAIFNHPSAPPFTLKMPPQVVIAIDGVLDKLVDLTDPTVQLALGTTRQELTGLWSSGSPTQILGQAAFDVGNITGLKYESAVNPPLGICLVVYLDRLAAPSWLEVIDPFNNLVKRLP